MAAIRAERARRAAEAERERIARDAERIRARCTTLAGFAREAWHVLEPATPLVWSWHLDAICQHLEAISRKQIEPWLIINVSPGSSKSTFVSVMWQAWEWGPFGAPASRFLTTSFEEENVKRDTRRTRDLIRSEWYQALWPAVTLNRAGETSFANTHTGTREGVPFASITGKRGDRVVIDDPHSLKGAESEAERNKATRLFLEGGLNRLNDQQASSIVVVMQRVHELDLTGVLLSRQLGFGHLMIPMEFEPERRCSTSLGWSDPRSSDGELMDPVRMPRAAVEKLKQVSAYSWAGQYQQRPTAREGGLFKRAWFEGKFIRQAPAGTKWVRHWDLAATAAKRKVSGQAATAGVKLGRAPDGSFIVGHVVRVFEEGHEVRRTIKAIAEADGPSTAISLPQDPGQAGKVQAADLIKMLPGWNVRAEPESGDKVTRAEPFSAQCEAGNVYLVEGSWNEAYLDELCMFPGAAAKDQVDASSGAFGQLIQKSHYGMLEVL